MSDKLSDEERLLRLYRCLNAQEQAETLRSVAIRLLKRYSIYSHGEREVIIAVLEKRSGAAAQ